ncbi:MAG: PQQ-dependent sugar dehydrogenase [Anaerolineales bacterium]|nr:PQQ-dependent sugar dehydrogenase [Anaerolineales bacterium]
MVAGTLAACVLNQPQATLLPIVTAPPEATATPLPASVTPTAAVPPSETAAPASPTAGATAVASPTAAPLNFNPDDYALRRITGGLTKPVFLTHAGDARLFIVEQPGTIRIFENGRLLPVPFLDIRDRVNDGANEQGLLGLAFHPRYTENGFFFVNYTGANDETVIARFSVTSDPNRADPAGEKVILTIEQPYRNHNGGDLAFGPDGYLYIGMGDGGSAGDPENRAQNLRSLLGKMLRLDVDNGEPYGIPPDNPFVVRGDARPEIWAYGLRNPWRFSFDRATGDLYIADVGQNAYEEVNFQPAGSSGGENYGWRYFEGTHEFKDAADAPPEVVPPIAEYGRGDGCSVTGGYVYRGAALPELNGVYFFGDYCSGLIWSLRRDAAGAWVRETFGDTDFTISSFGEDAAGELYVLDHRGGSVYLIVRR